MKILLQQYKQLLSYDAANTLKIGDHFALRWSIFAGLVTIYKPSCVRDNCLGQQIIETHNHHCFLTTLNFQKELQKVVGPRPYQPHYLSRPCLQYCHDTIRFISIIINYHHRNLCHKLVFCNSSIVALKFELCNKSKMYVMSYIAVNGYSTSHVQSKGPVHAK